MKKSVRMLAAVLVLAIAISAFPVSAFAVQDEYLEVIVDNAPIRKECYEKGDVVARCIKGAVLESRGATINRYLHKWYKVKYEGHTCYIYSDNVKTHSHDYQSLTLEGITLKICKNCGDIVSEDSKLPTYSEYASLAAVALPAMDGLLPVGDIVAAILLAYSVAKLSPAIVTVAEDIAEQIREIDFAAYLEKRNEKNCTPYSFRRVTRFPKGLKYLDSECMDYAEAYIWVAVFKGDVYTASEDAALILASWSPKGSICERDKDKESYFYHYHLSIDRSEKAHIFFGTNDFGQTPI